MRTILFLLGGSAILTSLSPSHLPEAQGQEVEKKDAEKKEDEAQREKLLKAMRSLAASYTLSIGENKKSRLKLVEEPLMRFSNPVGVSKDGAFFVWTDKGRPHALLKIYTTNYRTFFQEWQSLSEDYLFAERDGQAIWTPTVAGVEFREVPDAPKPGDTSAERLRQMKKLAGQFKGLYKMNDELRLLAQPLHRYEAKGTTPCIDATLFGLTQSTTPMVILQLEARKSGDSARWHYAIARFSTAEITVSLGDKEVFSVSKYTYTRDPKNPFLPVPQIEIPME
jgi:hypothetical protein